MFNLVIKMEKGKIYDIVWDNGCFDCDNSCQEGIISTSVFNSSETQTYDNCYETEACTINNDASNCDPKFYITWFGTDKKGNQLKTSNLAMSKFKKYSISSLYSSVKNVIK